MFVAARVAAKRFFVKSGKCWSSSALLLSLVVHSRPSDQFHNLSDTSIDSGFDEDCRVCRRKFTIVTLCI